MTAVTSVIGPSRPAPLRRMCDAALAHVVRTATIETCYSLGLTVQPAFSSVPMR
jgi:hypothetical protein